MSELKPCPFCGQNSASIDHADYEGMHPDGEYGALFVVHCACGAESTTCYTPEYAAEAWNSRAPGIEQAARRAALEEAAHYLDRLHAAAKGQHNYYQFAANGVRALAAQESNP